MLKGSRQAQNERIRYANSAQKVKIWARKSYSSDPSRVYSPKEYLYTHVKNCHPEEVLKTDDITLFSDRKLEENGPSFCPM